MPNTLPTTTDLVFVDTLRVEATLGEDCWGRARAQPVAISVYLNLHPSFLQTAGQTDDVLDSVHYGHLAKEVAQLVRAKSESAQPAFDGPDALIAAVSDAAFSLAGEACSGGACGSEHAEDGVARQWVLSGRDDAEGASERLSRRRKCAWRTSSCPCSLA